MEGNSYEEYKKELSRSEKKKEGIHSGKVCAVIGICMLVYVLYMLPYRAGNVHEVHGDEIKAGKEYYPVKVYQIDKLEVLEVKEARDSKKIYCIAKFQDCDQKDWIVLLTPGWDERLADELRSFNYRQKQGEGTTVEGCFLMKYLEDLPFEADSFYSVYGRDYADEEGSNMLGWNAEYLCESGDNYTLKTLFRRGIPLYCFVTALGALLYGVISLIRNRESKAV